MIKRIQKKMADWQIYKDQLKVKSYWHYFVVDLAETIIVALTLALIIRHYVIMTSVVPTGSMEPTLMAYEEGTNICGFIPRTVLNERLFVNKFIYRFTDPKRGDIVVFKSPLGDGKEYVKRCIGLPGDRLKVVKGQVYINDQLLVLPGVNVQKDYSSFDEVAIPTASYFMMGDNRANSFDSRYWVMAGLSSYVPRASILGKAWFTFWPFNRIRVLR